MSVEVNDPGNPTVPALEGAAATARPNLLINRNFALLWTGQTISVVGDSIFDTTLMLWVVTSLSVHQTWAPIAVSGIFLAASLPILLVGPLAGVFVDRWAARKVLLRMDLARAGLIGLLFLIVLAGWSPPIWQLGIMYGIVLAASACSQFFNPARLVLLKDIVADEQRARATGLLQLALSLATIIGPVLASFLYSAVGILFALGFNALSFVLSFVALRAIHAPQSAGNQKQEQQAYWRELRAGWAFCARNSILSTIIITLFVSLLGLGTVNALSVFFVEQNLHMPPAYYGILAMTLGIGTAIGSLGAGIGAQRLGLARTLWLSLLSMSVIFFIFSRQTNFVGAVITIFLLGLPISAFQVASTPLMLTVVPRAMIGRVAAVINPLQSLALMLSVVLAGTLESTVLSHFHLTLPGVTLGPVDTIFAGVAVLVLLAGLYAMRQLKSGEKKSESERISQ